MQTRQLRSLRDEQISKRRGVATGLPSRTRCILDCVRPWRCVICYWSWWNRVFFAVLSVIAVCWEDFHPFWTPIIANPVRYCRAARGRPSTGVLTMRRLHFIPAHSSSEGLQIDLRTLPVVGNGTVSSNQVFFNVGI